MGKIPADLTQFQALVDIVKSLRGPDGCPWDKEQTHQSLTKYAIEEVYEFVDAVESNNFNLIKEELGDLLLQVVLNAQVAQDDQKFDITDVIYSISQKMLHRHPHVFQKGEFEANNASDALKIFTDQKNKETKINRANFNIPKHLPALLASDKIGKKTHIAKFDWDNNDQVFAKVNEEFLETKEALKNYNQNTNEHNLKHLEEEIGDLLFSVAQLARHCSIDPEQALRKTNLKFEERYFKMIELSKLSYEDFQKLSLEQKEQYWTLAKNQIKNTRP